MTLVEEVEALAARTDLDPDEKRRLIAARKATGLRDALRAVWELPRPIQWVGANGQRTVVTLTTVDAPTVETPQGPQVVLRFDGAATRGGSVLAHPDGTPIFPITIVNPPVLIPGGTDVVRTVTLPDETTETRGYSTDVAALGLAFLQRAIDGA